MTFAKIFAVIAFFIFIPIARGQQDTAPQEVAPEFSVGLVPGDTVDVFFLDFPEAAQQHLTVSSNGTLFVPYAGQVKVAGLMPDEAQQAIVDALKSKAIVNSPQVSLNVVAARNLSVLVMGQVNQPRPVPLFAPAPLSMILDQTGGFTKDASYRILIVHKDGTPPTDVDLDRSMTNLRGLNVLVKPGDIVSVAQAGSFYALGEFNHPGVFPMTSSQHMTLLFALSMVGGPTINAALGKARILRSAKDGSREEIDVDLSKLEKGKVADPLIQADDILYVPKNYLKVIANSWLNQSLYALVVAQNLRSF